MRRLTSFTVAALFAGALLAAAPATAFAGVLVGVSVNFGPPAIPLYLQPPCPEPNYIWAPGYWGWGPAGYYWVPGTWVSAPQPGLLWTPGYWGWRNAAYFWYPGYWGPHIGFYGGVNYGFGYFGTGYVGGGWFGNAFRYNTAVTNVNTTVIRNVYVNRTVIVNNTTVNRVSYNGGPGGVQARATEAELAVQNERHVTPTTAQLAHVRTAARDRNLLATVNHGQPLTAAVARPLSFANRPENFSRIQAEDRYAAQAHVVSHGYTGVAHPGANREFAHPQTGPGYHPNAAQNQYRPAHPQSITPPKHQHEGP